MKIIILLCTFISFSAFAKTDELKFGHAYFGENDMGEYQGVSKECEGDNCAVTLYGSNDAEYEATGFSYESAESIVKFIKSYESNPDFSVRFGDSSNKTMAVRVVYNEERSLVDKAILRAWELAGVSRKHTEGKTVFFSRKQ